MACSACAKRRKKLQALKAEKKARRQGIQAAAIGAVLSVTEAVGNAIGIHGEVEDGSQGAGTNSGGNPEVAGTSGAGEGDPDGDGDFRMP